MTTEEKGGNFTTVDVMYRVQNVDDKEDFIEVVSSGTGADTQDKGVGKAMTGAYKYMLLKTFAIPTGDDPDKICSDELDAKQKENPKEEKAKEEPPKKEEEVKDSDGAVLNCVNCGIVVSQNVAKYSKDNFKKILCFECQKTAKK